MNCPKCNAVLSANSKFCTSCGNKIEAQPEVKNDTSAPAQQSMVACIKCGAPLKAGTKFCTKCGSGQNVQPTPVQQSTQPPVQPTPTPVQPVQQPPVQQPVQPAPTSVQPAQSTPVQPAPKKKNKAILPLVIILVLILFVVGGYFVLNKVFDVDPIAMITGKEEGSRTREDDEDSKDKDGVTDDEEKDDKGDGEDEEDSKEGVDPEVLEALIEQLETAEKAYTDGNYESALTESQEALNQFITLSEEYALDEDAEEQIKKGFKIASQAAIARSGIIVPQVIGEAGYTQIRSYLDPVLELAVTLEEKGFEIDSAEILAYNESFVQEIKDIFIENINEITKRDQWSRDEAWTYAENAYSIQENGKTVLFDENDLDDPLRLRYVYCLSWIMRKRCENGVADGSMTNQDAFNALISILEETDYNLLVLQDIITYGNAVGEDITGYQQAYNAIVQKIKEEQNLSIVNSGVNSGTSVDVRKFWYFNDLSGADVYKVDINNGTTQATRDWIRNNIPSYFE